MLFYFIFVFNFCFFTIVYELSQNVYTNYRIHLPSFLKLMFFFLILVFTTGRQGFSQCAGPLAFCNIYECYVTSLFSKSLLNCHCLRVNCLSSSSVTLASSGVTLSILIISGMIPLMLMLMYCYAKKDVCAKKSLLKIKKNPNLLKNTPDNNLFHLS